MGFMNIIDYGNVCENSLQINKALLDSYFLQAINFALPSVFFEY